jgi:hypothetical protein
MIHYSKNLTNVTSYRTEHQTTHHAAHIKKTPFTTQQITQAAAPDTMIPPRPSASSGFKIIGECDRPTSHGDAQSPQHGDAIF